MNALYSILDLMIVVVISVGVAVLVISLEGQDKDGAFIKNQEYYYAETSRAEWYF